MGNTTSIESSASSRDKEVKPFNAASTSKKQTGQPSLRPEVLRLSLRERGLCVGESDLKDALARHSTIVEAIQYLADLGVTRKNVKAQRPKASARNINSITGINNINTKREENTRPPLSPAGGLAVSKPAPKRSREDAYATTLDVAEMSRPRNERPFKRAMPCWMRPADSPFAKAFEGSGLGSSSGILATEDIVQLVDGMSRGDENVGQAMQLDKRVLLPLQPGSPPRHRCFTLNDSNKRLEPSTSPLAKALPTAEARRTFVSLPEQVSFGRMESTMGAVVEQWSEMTEEDKEEATRAVARDLRLPPVAPGRAEMLEENLSNRIYKALEFISGMSTKQAGVLVLTKLVRTTRKGIHDTTSTIGGRYAQIYQEGLKTAGAGRKSGRCSISPEGHNAHASDKLGSPDRTRASQRDGGRLFGQRSSSSDESRLSSDSRTTVASSSRHVFSGSFGVDKGLPPSGRSTFFPRAEGRQRSSPTSGLSRVFGKGAVEEEAGGPEAIGKVAPEEEVFWTATGVCKEALKKTSFCRREGEWLEDQARWVTAAEEDLEEGLARMLKDFRDAVAQLNGEKQAAMDEMESHTKDVISAHLTPDASTEDALRSLLTTLQKGGSAQEAGKLGKRQIAMNLYDSLCKSHENKSIELQLVTLAIHINSVLCKALYGDLLDIISDVKAQAEERRIACQNDLKCTARHVLDKLKDAINFHIKRKRTAEHKMEVGLQSQAEDRRLFGDGSTASAQLTKMHIAEMKRFAEESTAKMRSIREAAETLWSKTEIDLPEEDFMLLSQSAKQFFVSEAELACAELGGSNPGGLQHGGLGDGDDCAMM